MRTEPYSLTDIVDVITRTFARMQGAALEAGEFADLSIRQITCLELIAQLEDPTATDLVRTLQVTKPTVSALLARLLQNGYVRKERSPTDARAWHDRLLAIALELQNKGTRRAQKFSTPNLALLTPDVTGDRLAS